MGHVFEHVCRDYLLRENSADRLPILFGSIGRWWGTDSRTRTQAEIDLVAQDGSAYLFGECKWGNEELGYEVFQELQDKAVAFDKRPEEIWYILFSKSGFSDSLLKADKEDSHLLLISANDML